MDKDKSALVSVIMPTYNSEQYLEKSINAVLIQTYKDLELIIINDCSSDNTVELVETLAVKDNRIKLINNKVNLGCANSRNIGLQKAKGSYIAFCDSDDIWHNKKIDIQLDCIEKFGADIVFTDYEMVDAKGESIKYRQVNPKVNLDSLLKENFIIFSTTFYKKNSINDILFKSEWFHEDYIFLLECLQRNKVFVGINESLVKYRVHENGRSYNKLKSAQYRWKIYRNFLKLGLIKSLYYFINYIFYGVTKYN